MALLRGLGPVMIISDSSQFSLRKLSHIRGLILAMSCSDDGFSGEVELDIIGIA